MKPVILSAAMLAVFSLGSLVQAQEPTDTLLSTPMQQQNAQSPAPSPDSAYGGVTAGQSASGKTSSRMSGSQSTCAPMPFCNIYSGGQ